jgi:tetratricopeptide (TPR) repeat protein
MNSKKTLAALAVLVLAPATFGPGCQSKGDSQLLGAGLGAVAGGVAGHAIGGRKHHTAGTIIGAVVGGVGGYLIGGQFGTNATPEEQASPQYRQASTEFDAGSQAHASGNEQAAVQHYQEASRLCPQDPVPYNNAGVSYLAQGDKRNAEMMFRKALEVDPEFDPAKTNLRQMGLTP